jgi:hypothetical protein
MDAACKTACLKHCFRCLYRQPGLIVGCFACRAVLAFGLNGRGDPALLWFFREGLCFGPAPGYCSFEWSGMVPLS